MSRRLELALEASGVGVWELHPTTKHLIWDTRMSEIFGLSSGLATLGYDDFRERVHPDDIAEVEEALTESIETRRKLVGQFRISTPSGETRIIRAHGVTHIMPDGERVVIGANWDVTKDILLQEELRDAEERARAQNEELEAARNDLEFQALHDPLTGLPNRRYVERFIERLKATPATERKPIACIHIDLDRFKEVNDTAGHNVGDAVLRSISQVLVSLSNSACFIARIGGDEFVIFIQAANAGELASEIGASIVTRVAKPISADGREWRLGASVGIAVQDTSCDISQLIADADIALYEAKKRGKGRVRLYTPTLRSEFVTSRQLADEILAAIEQDQFVPFFQPQFDAKSLEIVGAEALVRWNHPERGLISPAAFLPVAEKIGKLCAIDEIILTKSLDAVRKFEAEGFRLPRVSVNVSAQRLREESFLSKLSSLRFNPGSLSFELLESISFDEEDHALSKAIESVRGMGIELEIDDFGTGHASLVSLIELAPHRLKIDRKLVKPLASSNSQRKLISSVVDIARSMDIGVVAEGVETFEQIEILRALGCSTLQGFRLAKPMPESEVVRFALGRGWMP
ncbi:putative bifunctional diguanylate cyclase/phosphodiesterase [Rhizobium leguminosarum]|uniref:putative bifunctional diguanylate cyclase/phosphodiesterase n=1 Tax=Rhizobium leguminosarum TaxID=384 RepID=UPI001FED6763|nr:GGDEF domain-containing phosphodiesterase [Rhizobium leguminosarum]